MTKPQKPLKLNDLLLEYLLAASLAPTEGARRPGTHGFIPNISAREWSVASDIFAMLGEDSGFEAPFEVLTLLDLERDECPANAAEASRLADALARPLEQWPFDVALALSEMPMLEGDFGGERELRVRQCTLGGASVLALSGRVSAKTVLGAQVAVERLALAWIGAAYSLGLVELHFDPESLQYPGTVSRLGEVERPLSAEATHIVEVTVPCLPSDSSELEARAAALGDERKPIERHIRLLRRLMIDGAPRAQQLRDACRMAAVAATSFDFGVSVTLAFSVIEGLLLDPIDRDDLVARLAEAVAQGLGRSAEERTKLRGDLKRLYKFRSNFVHAGRSVEASNARQETMHLLAEVVRRELEQLG